MPVPKVLEDASGIATRAQEFLASLTNTIETIGGAGRDVNARPVDSSGGLLDDAESALGNLQKAAQLRQLLPWVFVAGGVLLGKPVLGIALGIVVHLAGSNPAPATPAAP